jgi:hypothetical protein
MTSAPVGLLPAASVGRDTRVARRSGWLTGRVRRVLTGNLLRAGGDLRVPGLDHREPPHCQRGDEDDRDAQAVKKPICSTARVSVPPTGLPAVTPAPVHIGASTLPTTNQAPLSAAGHAPNSAAGRRYELTSTIRPPASAPAPGRISSHSRLVV